MGCKIGGDGCSMGGTNGCKIGGDGGVSRCSMGVTNDCKIGGGGGVSGYSMGLTNGCKIDGDGGVNDCSMGDINGCTISGEGDGIIDCTETGCCCKDMSRLSISGHSGLTVRLRIVRTSLRKLTNSAKT